MGNFCLLPFTHFSTRTNGDITPCCRYMGKIGNIKEQSLEEIWNGEYMRELRRQFLADQRPGGCWQCWELEDSGGISMRQSMLFNRDYQFERSEEQSFKVPVIELKMSNLCNLRCRTCKPDLSTTWLKDWETVRGMYAAAGMNPSTDRMENYGEEFFEALMRLAPTIDILEFAGGEPLMDPAHYRVLESLGEYAKNIEVKYSTNLSRLGIGKWDVMSLWKGFRSVDLSVSMDGHPELNDYIRTESDTRKIAENIKAVREELGPRAKGRIALCFSAFNAYYLPEAYSYFVRELDMPVHGNIAHDPIFINLHIIPVELKQKILRRYDDFRGQISDMSSYHQKRIDRFLTTNSNFMMLEDKSDQWKTFQEFVKVLDRSRATNFNEIAKEYYDDMG